MSMPQPPHRVVVPSPGDLVAWFTCPGADHSAAPLESRHSRPMPRSGRISILRTCGQERPAATEEFFRKNSYARNPTLSRRDLPARTKPWPLPASRPGRRVAAGTRRSGPGPREWPGKHPAGHALGGTHPGPNLNQGSRRPQLARRARLAPSLADSLEARPHAGVQLCKSAQGSIIASSEPS